MLAELLVAYPEASRQREMQSCMLPLHIAAANRADGPAVRALLAAHLEGASEPDERGMLPLHLAAIYHAPPGAVGALLQACPGRSVGAAYRALPGLWGRPIEVAVGGRT